MTTYIYTLSLHDALPISPIHPLKFEQSPFDFQKSATLPYTSHLLPNAQSTTAYLPILSAPFYFVPPTLLGPLEVQLRSEEHTSELQSRGNLVCVLLLEKK